MQNDKVTGWLRTAVPIAWGYAVAWLLTLLPGSADLLAQFGIDLNSETTVNFITGIAAAGWYALFRWLEPRLPAWVTRVVLGSNQEPVYVGTLVDDDDLEFEQLNAEETGSIHTEKDVEGYDDVR